MTRFARWHHAALTRRRRSVVFSRNSARQSGSAPLATRPVGGGAMPAATVVNSKEVQGYCDQALQQSGASIGAGPAGAPAFSEEATWHF